MPYEKSVAEAVLSKRHSSLEGAVVTLSQPPNSSLKAHEELKVPHQGSGVRMGGRMGNQIKQIA